jgi:hypothetical protein
MSYYLPILPYNLVLKQAEQDAEKDWYRGFLQLIVENPENHHLSLEGMNQNINIAEDIIQQHRTGNWNIIEENPNIQWDWEGLSSHPSLTWEIVQSLTNKPWDWKGISRHANITWDIIQKNKDKPWDWSSVGENSNVTWEIIQANTDIRWDWAQTSKNTNLTWDIVLANPDTPWDWEALRSNKMRSGHAKARYVFIRTRLQQWFSCSNLKEELMATVWHPRNIHRFKDLDPDFQGCAAEEEEDDEAEDDTFERTRQKI